MKPLNKFHLISDAQFFTLIKEERFENLSREAIREFFNPKSNIPLDYTRFMPIHGLN